MKRLIAAALLATLASAGAYAQAPGAKAVTMEHGLAVGAKAPAFSATTQTGAPATLESIKGDKGVTLMFVRSADWCPFCKKQMKEMNDVAAELKSLGYPLVSLSYDSTDILTKFASSSKLSYTLLSDPNSAAIDAFGVRNEEVRESKRFNGIPHPAIFVIGSDNVIKAKLAEERYQDRPPAELVVSTVRALP